MLEGRIRLLPRWVDARSWKYCSIINDRKYTIREITDGKYWTTVLLRYAEYDEWLVGEKKKVTSKK
jgi:hypothetical protein